MKQKTTILRELHETKNNNFRGTSWNKKQKFYGNFMKQKIILGELHETNYGREGNAVSFICSHIVRNVHQALLWTNLEFNFLGTSWN